MNNLKMVLSELLKLILLLAFLFVGIPMLSYYSSPPPAPVIKYQEPRFTPEQKEILDSLASPVSYKA